MENIHSPSRHAGFSLVEAMVALLVVGLIAAAGFALLNHSVVLTTRLADDVDRERAAATALEIVRRVNPMLQPQGESLLADGRLTWDAQAIAGPTRNVGGPNGGGVFDVALFNVSVRATRDDREWFTLKVRQIGYRRTAPYGEEFRSR